jgi:hypothetical protein
MNRVVFSVAALSLVCFAVAPLFATTVAYSDIGNGVRNMTQTDATKWVSGYDITQRDTVFDIRFDYTQTLRDRTFADPDGVGGDDYTPVIIWEAGGTGDGASLLLLGPDLVWVAGDNATDYTQKAHGLSPGTNDVQVVTKFFINTNGTDDEHEIWVNGVSKGTNEVAGTSRWAGPNGSALGQVNDNSIFQEGSGVPSFNKGNAVNFNAGAPNQLDFRVYDATDTNFSIDDVLVPEPSTLFLAALGLLGLIGFGRRRKR